MPEEPSDFTEEPMDDVDVIPLETIDYTEIEVPDDDQD